MPQDTRQAILHSAKTLFNERGYNDVSTRDIAESLGISKGNLTYYFKKKEDIIEAIIVENASTQPEAAPTTLEELNTFFKDIQITAQENAFYFWHHAQLAQVSEKIRKLQVVKFKDNTRMLTEALNGLRQDGVIREEESEGEYKMTVDTLLLTSVYWVPFCELKEDHSHKGFIKQAWSILNPFLTKKGKEELNNIIR